jgi:hypothetical protein
MSDRFTTEANFDERSLSREACAFTLELLSCAFDRNEFRFETLVVEPIGDAGGPFVGHDLCLLLLSARLTCARLCLLRTIARLDTIQVGHNGSFERRGRPTAREDVRED